MRKSLIVFGAIFLVPTAANAADYRDGSYVRGPYASAPRYVGQYSASPGIRPPRPLYVVQAPPRYVQDLRINAPGQWVVREPTVFERLFGPSTDLYY